MDSYFGQKLSLKLNILLINLLQICSFSLYFSHTLSDGLESCGLHVMFSSAVWTHSDGTHSLQRIYISLLIYICSDKETNLDSLRVSKFSFLGEVFLWRHHKNYTKIRSATYMHNVQSQFTVYTPAQLISGQNLKYKQQRWRWRSEEENIQGRWTLRLINTCKIALTVGAGQLSRWKHVSGHEPHATTFHRHIVDQHGGTGPQAKLVPDNFHINNQLQATWEDFECIQCFSKSFNNLTS